MKKYSYIGIAFIILIFGIYAIPKIVNRFKTHELVKIGEVPSFEFTNQDGKLISDAFYKNKVYVIEFFFTTCPTICPKMNANMVKLQNEYYGNLDFGIASFSINPEYDTPEILKEYAKNHGATLKNWNFLTGDKETIYNLANKGIALYAGENSEAEGGFEHSGMFALIDKQGNIRSRLDEYGNPIAFYDGLDAKNIQMIKEDIAILLKE
ncbi:MULTISPECIES: SCO family protein [Flavobacteriaceae]|uniref:SCO family protein n=2 Tax=Flavobacteriaceae TaxID=49546 RepID=A0A4Y8ASI3_9FLAO|nr:MULTISPECIES: SCO family protein [Flavobacteriaceae]TEW73606.1 SCO family protein [Gramella jeungdoensis]GGK36036.1 photosynthetic protein synthase II [Lutibacter litoralis]